MTETRSRGPEFFEYEGATLDPTSVVVGCIESGAPAILIDRNALPAEFFDLSTGVAGALVQKVTNYGVRMACVVPDPAAHSARFQDFLREANRGRQFHFAATRDGAIAWLRSSREA